MSVKSVPWETGVVGLLLLGLVAACVGVVGPGGATMARWESAMSAATMNRTLPLTAAGAAATTSRLREAAIMAITVAMVAMVDMVDLHRFQAARPDIIKRKDRGWRA
jgi:hypothetical protein